MLTYYLSLGSNLGNREQNIRSALQLIEQHTGIVTRCSSFFYSEPWGFQSEHPFCNLCCCVRSELTPLAFLARTAHIEQTLGRACKSQNGVYHDRTIDIDIIRAFDDEGKEIILKNEQMVNGRMVNILTLPHPLYTLREFVTVPLSEIFEEK